jgi:hypothetical protein
MKNAFEFKKLIVPGVVMLAFWGIALWGYLASGYTRPLIMFGYIGTSLGVGLGLYGTLPKQQKPLGRRLTLFLVGLFLVGFAIFLGYENVQIEGFLFGLLTGVIQMGVIAGQPGVLQVLLPGQRAAQSNQPLRPAQDRRRCGEMQRLRRP